MQYCCTIDGERQTQLNLIQLAKRRGFKNVDYMMVAAAAQYLRAQGYQIILGTVDNQEDKPADA